MRIIQLTDMHLTSDVKQLLYGGDTHVLLQEALKSAMALNPAPDCFFVTGDLTEDGTEVSYQHFREMFEAWGLPVYVIPGNHDRPEVMTDVFQESLIRFYFSAILENWCCLFLNSQVVGQSHGLIDDETMSQLEVILANEATKPVLIALHHPPLPSCPFAGCQLSNATEFIHVLRKQEREILILTGHLHIPVDQQKKNIRVLTTPSTFAGVSHPSINETDIDHNDFWKCHNLEFSRRGFRILDIDPSGSYSTEVRWLSGSL